VLRAEIGGSAVRPRPLATFKTSVRRSVASVPRTTASRACPRLPLCSRDQPSVGACRVHAKIVMALPPRFQAAPAASGVVPEVCEQDRRSYREVASTVEAAGARPRPIAGPGRTSRRGGEVPSCLSWRTAHERLVEALDPVGRGDAQVGLTLFETGPEAVAANFAGSPTILVDGRDLFPGPGVSRRAWRAGCTQRLRGWLGHRRSKSWSGRSRRGVQDDDDGYGLEGAGRCAAVRLLWSHHAPRG
jgi:hypothetical protein